MTLPPDPIEQMFKEHLRDVDAQAEADTPQELRVLIQRAILGRQSTPASAHAARAVLAAGYRKRRTIKTLEEFKTLSDLPKASVLLLSDNICVVQKAWDGTWYEVGAGRVYPILDWLPTTVLYDPSEES